MSFPFKRSLFVIVQNRAEHADRNQFWALLREPHHRALAGTFTAGGKTVPSFLAETGACSASSSMALPA